MIQRKLKSGVYRDGSGSRFLIGPLYLLMDDTQGAAAIKYCRVYGYAMWALKWRPLFSVAYGRIPATLYSLNDSDWKKRNSLKFFFLYIYFLSVSLLNILKAVKPRIGGFVVTRKKSARFLSCIVAGLIVLLSGLSPAFADNVDAPPTLSPSLNKAFENFTKKNQRIGNLRKQKKALIPFSSSALSDPSLCRYVSPSNQDGHGGKPPLFRNVEKIYVRVNGYGYFPKKQERAIDLLTVENLSSLAGCTLEKFFPVSSTSSESAKPIYFPGSNLTQWPADAGLSGSLVILMNYQLISGEGFYEKLFDDKIVLLQVNYYRYGSNSLDDARYSQCAQAFQYVEDEETMLRLLTKAVHGCLDQEYHSMGG